MQFFNDAVALEYWLFWTLAGLAFIQLAFSLIRYRTIRQLRKALRNWERFGRLMGFNTETGYWDLDQLSAYVKGLYKEAIMQERNRKPGPR